MTAGAPQAPASADPLLFSGRVQPPLPDEWSCYLATHGRSFSFASTLIPEPYRSRVIAVYAYCRYTDDLVDRSRKKRAESLAQLDYWLDASESAYRGEPSEHALLNVVMGDMADANVPFEYAADLIRGMRMDVLDQRYETVAQLRVYCHRVASVVGLWLTEMFGVHDGATLQRAARLGVAMQLTNIIRDVGDDWRRGRLYLPADIMRARGLTTSMIARIATSDAPIPPEYIAVIQDLMVIAEADYHASWQGIPALPQFFGSAVAVASRVYNGIHEAVRENGYDTIRMRAATSTARKVVIARQTLRDMGVRSSTLEPDAAEVTAP